MEAHRARDALIDVTKENKEFEAIKRHEQKDKAFYKAKGSRSTYELQLLWKFS